MTPGKALALKDANNHKQLGYYHHSASIKLTVLPASTILTPMCNQPHHCSSWNGSMNFLENQTRNNNVSWRGKVVTLKNGNNLFTALTWPLAAGVCLGLIPIRGIVVGKHSFT